MAIITISSNLNMLNVFDQQIRVITNKQTNMDILQLRYLQ